MPAIEPIGVVLAGGKSSRMGLDKATLCIDNQPLLLLAQRTFHEAGFRRVYLSGNARLGWSGHIVPDCYPEFGPVGGIVSVLRTLFDTEKREACILFVPVDTPLISSKLLTTMLEKTGTDGGYFEGTPLPLLLKLTDAVFQQCTHALADFIVGRTCSVKQFIAPLALARLTANEFQKNQLINVNTPNEWKALCFELENRT